MVGSLFAGIGGFDLGLEQAGHTVLWHSEIEPHASAVLRYRWPDIPNLGDVTKIDGAAIPPVDVICGGAPCQDLSVAGKRHGFTGKRSVLVFEFLRIVEEMRRATDGAAPTFLIYENVPGLFSSHGGKDFARLLDEVGELGALDVAWRVLDSRYFGVAQRRRRVFLVADFGGERACSVLTEPESLRGDPPKGRTKREDVAHALRGRANASHREDSDTHVADLAPTLSSRYEKSVNGNWSGRPGDDLLLAHTLTGEGHDAGEDGPGRGTPIVVSDPISAHEQSTYTHEGKGNFRLRNVVPIQDGRGLEKAQNGIGIGDPGAPSYTVDTTGSAAVAFDTTQITSAENRCNPQPGDPCHPLAAGAHPPAVAFQTRGSNVGVTEEMTGTLGTTCDRASGSAPMVMAFRNDASRDGKARTPSADAEGRVRLRDAGFNPLEEMSPTLDSTAPHSVGLASGVRRLTPTECERLQGFPDSWTARGTKPDGTVYDLPDSARYRCLGNAVTVNVARWIGRRIPHV